MPRKSVRRRSRKTSRKSVRRRSRKSVKRRHSRKSVRRRSRKSIRRRSRRHSRKTSRRNSRKRVRRHSRKSVRRHSRGRKSKRGYKIVTNEQFPDLNKCLLNPCKSDCFDFDINKIGRGNKWVLNDLKKQQEMCPKNKYVCDKVEKCTDKRNPFTEECLDLSDYETCDPDLVRSFNDRKLREEIDKQKFDKLVEDIHEISKLPKIENEKPVDCSTLNSKKKCRREGNCTWNGDKWDKKGKKGVCSRRKTKDLNLEKIPRRHAYKTPTDLLEL